MSLSRIAVAIVTSASLAVSACTAPAEAPGNTPAANTPAAESEVPSEPGRQLSALAPANIAKARPAAPFDLTGNWFIDVSRESGRLAVRSAVSEADSRRRRSTSTRRRVAAKEGKVYRDDIGQCWPAGLPLIMTRYWPMAMIQIPTAIYMVSGFMNSLRIVYLDGRQHTDPDIVVRTFNGESIGRWEGDTLVVDTAVFRGDHHWMDQGGASIPAGEQLHIVERIRLINDGKQLEIEYTMTDPENWEGEWKSTKRFNRVNDEDIQEVSCLPDLNEHLQSTTSKTQVQMQC